jgi:acyl carrier protein
VDESIRSILAEHGRLSVDAAQLGDDDDLYRVGLTSHSTVNVMLALEDCFDIEIPDTMLRKSTFQSIASIRAAVIEVTSSPPSA